MTLHIFNPDHDMALAAGSQPFTPPSAATRLRQEWWWLPALWASPGDCVLCAPGQGHDPAAKAMLSDPWCSLPNMAPGTVGLREVAMRRMAQLGIAPVAACQLRGLGALRHIDPWGWNAALVRLLALHGVGRQILPSDECLQAIRQLSHRRTAAGLLPRLRLPLTTGQAAECFALAGVMEAAERHGGAVLKAPWSGSGRGVRIVGATLTSSQAGWVRNVIKRQGSIIAEPYYNKVMDFAMEFMADGAGDAHYLGLSVFATSGVAYAGGIVAPEQAGQAMVCRHLSGGSPLLHAVRTLLEHHLGRLCMGIYRGVLGVDMMAVDGGLLHPCVEINFRRTMGHVALALEPMAAHEPLAMQTNTNDNYQLTISKT